MMYGNYGMGLWGTLFMLVGGLLLLGLIVVGVLLLAHYLKGSDQPSASAGAGPSARQVLSQRYARGEIDENEYTQRLNVLNATEPRRGGG
ncbi:putative membrane protein [Promicromonospora sp. AC04]|uniref:SHOCT domain-containing protein n=1 Tax=Promicromonospora sp. AC04 TaxID=2135723 RepID=UPI000D3BDC46|nr:SHOCT domain-containing protein [Promicromonospora sp. AC04]PUB29828.1 putative membrane protein [Promicromonospora sp. AC04]